jgi:ADP-ribosylglycohydrolase
MIAAPSGAERLALCRDSLAGLSVGDALGAQYFVPGAAPTTLAAGHLPAGRWPWTDDTEMACSVVAVLDADADLDRDWLARSFAEHRDLGRGYGAGAVTILRRIREGVPWVQAARETFAGTGSMGNGAAMRVAPLGAYHVGRPDHAARQAARSAEVTHAHPEGIAGAVAVAVAASVAADARRAGQRPTPEAFLDALSPYLTEGGAVTLGVARARRLLGASVAEAAYELGNGSRTTAPDTVPFALWVAATRLADYPAAVTDCVLAGGDVDTTAAIVGGIVAAYTGIGDRPGSVGVPPEWLARREPLPEWLDARLC